MTWLTDDELLIVWRFNFADTGKQRFLEIARAAIAADRNLTATLAEPADGPAPEGEVAELVAWLKENAEDERQMSEATTRASLMLDRAADLLQRQAAPVPVPVAIPGEQYHDDMGPVTWWRLPVEEPPWVGSPNDSDWPGYHTHFTPAPPEPALPLPVPGGEVE